MIARETRAETSPVRIGVVGASWRAQYYFRIARALPEQFQVTGVLVRTAHSVEAVAAEWAIGATTSLEAFLHDGPYDFVVVAVPVEHAGDLVRAFASRNIPVLVETPPASSLEEMEQLYRDTAGAPVQVAEQYRFQPHHAARLSVARSGALGQITSAHVSVAHGYHGISLIRFALGVGFEPAQISGFEMVDRVVSARGRDDWNAQYTESDALNTMALFQFSDSSGVFEFSTEQYFSPIRARHITIRGSRGELRGDEVDYLTVPGFAAHERLAREETGRDGDLEASFLRRVTLRDTAHWSNRFAPARLNDDELAVAEVMHRMARFVRTGTAFYSIADASHDHYLGLLMNEAVATGHRLTSATTAWSHEASTCVEAAADD